MGATEAMSVMARAGRSDEALAVVRKDADSAARTYAEIMAAVVPAVLDVGRRWLS